MLLFFQSLLSSSCCLVIYAHFLFYQRIYYFWPKIDSMTFHQTCLSIIFIYPVNKYVLIVFSWYLIKKRAWLQSVVELLVVSLLEMYAVLKWLFLRTMLLGNFWNFWTLLGHDWLHGIMGWFSVIGLGPWFCIHWLILCELI